MAAVQKEEHKKHSKASVKSKVEDAIVKKESSSESSDYAGHPKFAKFNSNPKGSK